MHAKHVSAVFYEIKTCFISWLSSHAYPQQEFNRAETQGDIMSNLARKSVFIQGVS